MKKKSINELSLSGFKEIPNTNILINKKGKIWNNGVFTFPKKVLTPNGKISIEKAIDLAFKPLFEEKEVIAQPNKKTSLKEPEKIMSEKKRKEKPTIEYKRIPTKEYYISELGKVWKNGRLSNPKTISTEYGEIRTAKVVLWLFKKETPRNGTIIHLDGNKSNNSVQNVKYARLPLPFEYENLNNEKINLAIRSCCKIDQKEKIQISILTIRMALASTFEEIKFTPSIDNGYYYIFKHWIEKPLINPKELTELYNLSIRDFRVIRNHYLNEFTAYVVSLNKPLEPYNLTKREEQKELTAQLHGIGIKRTKKLSPKQQLEKWNKRMKEVDNYIEENLPIIDETKQK